jgi:hypothetical protein
LDREEEEDETHLVLGELLLELLVLLLDCGGKGDGVSTGSKCCALKQC